MLTRRNPQWLHAAIQALLLFSTTEAVTLSQFQQISADQIPSNCLSVYTSVIAGCVEADFTTGASCSARCAQGISAKELNLQNFCAGIQVNPKSLIGIALGGGLLGLLCPIPIATSPLPTTTSPLPTTTSPLPIATSTKIPGFSTIPFPTTTAKNPADTLPPPTIITSTADPKVTSKPPSPPPASPPPPSTTIVQTPTLVPPPSTSDLGEDEETSTSVSTETSPTTTITPPLATNINPPPGPVSPPAGNDQTPQPIEQNGSPFANINFVGSGNLMCAPSIPRTIWLSFAVGLILKAI